MKAILWIEQDSAEASPEEDAWYDHQLVGLAVHRDGQKVGTVARVDHFPAQDLLIVTTATGEVMVPFVKAIVPAVDIEAGIVTVTPPAGLFEELPEDDVEDAPRDGCRTISRPASDACHGRRRAAGLSTAADIRRTHAHGANAPRISDMPALSCLARRRCG